MGCSTLGSGRWSYAAYQTLKRHAWSLQDKLASRAYTRVAPVFVLFFVFFWIFLFALFCFCFSFIYCSTGDRTQGLAHARRVLDH